MQASDAKTMTRAASVRHKSRRNWGILIRRWIGKGFIYLALISLSILYFLPIWWMAITSVKTLKEAYSYPPTFFPRTFTLEGYTSAWEWMDWKCCKEPGNIRGCRWCLR